MSTYALATRGPLADNHHRYLSAMLDPFTFGRLSGLRDLNGLHCLDLGAGGYSVARWLVGQVGRAGRVVATDLNPGPVEPGSGMLVERRDVVTEPVPHPPYDLIHARLLLAHVPERDAVLRNLARPEVLAPGGAVVISDWDMTWRKRRVLRTPMPADEQAWLDIHDVMIDVLIDSGVEPDWASRVPALMSEAGLRDIDVKIHAEGWAGGSAGCMLLAGTTVHLEAELIKRGVTERELIHARALLANPKMMIRAWPLVSTVGWAR